MSDSDHAPAAPAPDFTAVKAELREIMHRRAAAAVPPEAVS